MTTNDHRLLATTAAARAGRQEGPPVTRHREPLAWLPWYLGDWLRTTRGWSLAARGLYQELVGLQWDRGALPLAPEDLRALVSATPTEWATAWPVIASHFPRRGSVRLNPQLAGLRDAQERLRERRRAGAARTNRGRWGSPSESLSDTPGGSLNGHSANAERVARERRVVRRNVNVNNDSTPHHRGYSTPPKGSRP